MSTEEIKGLKSWQGPDGKMSSMRVTLYVCLFSGIAMLWFQLIGAAVMGDFALSDVEWWGPLGLISVGITGKGVQKFGEGP